MIWQLGDRIEILVSGGLANGPSGDLRNLSVGRYLHCRDPPFVPRCVPLKNWRRTSAVAGSGRQPSASRSCGADEKVVSEDGDWAREAAPACPKKSRGDALAGQQRRHVDGLPPRKHVSLGRGMDFFSQRLAWNYPQALRLSTFVARKCEMTDTMQSQLPSDFDSFAREVRRLAEERNAIILAHNYQVPWIQDVADHVGDSLALSRIAAESEAETIVFCGVHFMAETAKILSPDRTVLIPDPNAGCSLADTITAEQVISWRNEHPGAVVVAYVNTSADVKAEVDICCTSSNAVDIVNSLPEDAEILFLPDYFLGAHVARATGRNVLLWMGECHVHAGITPVALRSRLEASPTSQLLVHPECGCTSAALYLVGSGEVPPERTHIVSTGSMVDFARSAGDAHVLVATETGILHQLRTANTRATFEAVNPAAVCQYMKMITPEKLLNCLRDRDASSFYEVTVEEEIRVRALKAVEGMIAIGLSSSFGE